MKKLLRKKLNLQKETIVDLVQMSMVNGGDHLSESNCTFCEITNDPTCDKTCPCTNSCVTCSEAVNICCL